MRKGRVWFLMHVTIPRHHVFTRNERTFSRSAKKNFFLTPFRTYLYGFGGEEFMEISENPGPLPGGKIFFRFFFFFSAGSLFPPSPKVSIRPGIHLTLFLIFYPRKEECFVLLFPPSPSPPFSPISQERIILPVGGSRASWFPSHPVPLIITS